MLLHEQRARLFWIHGNVMNAVADLSIGIGNVLRTQTAINRLPALTAIVGAECTSGGNCDPNSFRIFRIENDGVEAHAACARLPLGPGAVSAQSRELVPALSAIGRTEDGCVFDSGIDGVWIGERRLQMPDALELPGVRLAIIKLVRGHGRASFGRCVIDELVALALGHAAGAGLFTGRRSRLMPGLAAIVRALDHLAEPSAGLRSVNAVRVDGRTFQVIQLPASEMRTADVPFLALSV